MSPSTDVARGWLVLDASTRTLRVGVLQGEGWSALAEAEGDALESLFGLTHQVLKAGGHTLSGLAGVYFCAGPGSLLGLRLAAMALSTWSVLPQHRHWRLHQYHSLALAAADRQLAGETDFHLISPFRRGQFNHLAATDGKAGELTVCDEADLAALLGSIYHVNNGTLRQPPPRDVIELPYPLVRLPAALAAYPEHFRPVTQPKVYVPLAPTFAHWSAERHRAPSNDA